MITGHQVSERGNVGHDGNSLPVSLAMSEVYLIARSGRGGPALLDQRGPWGNTSAEKRSKSPLHTSADSTHGAPGSMLSSSTPAAAHASRSATISDGVPKNGSRGPVDASW